MTLSDIKKAVRAGKIVCLGSDVYRVTNPVKGQWLIHCILNDYCTGLTWLDGETINGEESDFYILEAPE